MGNRHIPRLCRSCASPMAGQEATCWSCGAAYAPVGRSSTTTTAATAGARWDDDGGRSVVATNGIGPVAPTPVRVAVGRYNGATRIG